MQPASLQQLISAIGSICNSHSQVGSFQYCETPEVDTNVPPPFVVCFAADPSQSGIVMSTPFSLLVVDLVNKSEDNKSTVSSDMLQLTKDILAKLRIPNDYYILDESINYRGIYDALPMDVTGWGVDFTLKSVNLFDSCSVPGIAIEDEGQNVLVDEDNNLIVYE